MLVPIDGVFVVFGSDFLLQGNAMGVCVRRRVNIVIALSVFNCAVHTVSSVNI